MQKILDEITRVATLAEQGLQVKNNTNELFNSSLFDRVSKLEINLLQASLGNSGRIPVEYNMDKTFIDNLEPFTI
jgi:hypothetical protein